MAVFLECAAGVAVGAGVVALVVDKRIGWIALCVCGDAVAGAVGLA